MKRVVSLFMIGLFLMSIPTLASETDPDYPEPLGMYSGTDPDYPEPLD